MKLQLSSGMDYGIGANGEKICRGAKMGRPNILPLDINAPIKLRLEKLRLVDGDYDVEGCYWGGSAGSFIYCAWLPTIQIFVRAKNREAAKQLVKEELYNVTFFR